MTSTPRPQPADGRIPPASTDVSASGGPAAAQARTPLAGTALLTLVERALGAGTAAHHPGRDHLRLTLPRSDGGPGGGESVPLTVDVVTDPERPPRGIVYLLPGGGLNCAAAFLTPARHGAAPGHDGLAHHFLRQGHLVVGVTPREDAARPGDVTAEWGLAAHRRDLAGVVAALDSVLGLPYQYAGHSAGGALALDAASHDPSPRLRRVVVLDTTGPLTGEDAVRAGAARDAYAAQLAAGTYASDPGLAALVSRAVTDPDGASAAPWPPDPALRFTHAGLAHYALIRTATLPGPANWIYARGHAAGTYAFGATPAEDRFTLTHTPLAVWHAATAALGSGLIPLALLRDLTAIWAGDSSTYALAWDRIRTEVLWLNTEYGRGDHPEAADLIRASGNPRVTYRVLPNHAHADITWSPTAPTATWPLL
ncbi:hypothetical protein ABZY31_04555 [Streptomyces sp. NPDC006529]|uniref:hypothetical protein n=1 Tax=Streptomyces sp. NPDC006529 TaxID=3157177 RepID=UPI0033ACB0D7